MAKGYKKIDLQSLPACAAEFIRLVIKRMRYRKKVRRDVQAELAAHFEDELKDCTTDKQKEQKAQKLIADFGDVKLLGVLLRRAKKRCRPLWRTVVARMFQTIGILILCFILYTAWFLTGKPTISVDYLAIINQMNKPELSEKDNAWPHYEKAIELYVKPSENLEETDAFRNYKEIKSFGDITAEEKKEVIDWVGQNQAAWQEFATASSKLHCYRKAEYNTKDEEKWLWNILMPALAELRGLSKLGIWRAEIAVEQNKIQQSVEDCLVIIKTGRFWQNSKVSIVEQLVGLAISRLAHQEILHITETEKLSAAQLKRLQQQLLEIYPGGFPPMDIEGERLMLLDIVQHLFTDGGLGGGHLVPRQLSFIKDTVPFFGIDRDYPGYQDRWLQAFKAIAYTTAGMVHARRDETIAKGSEIYDKLSEIVKMSPYERQMQKISSDDIILALPQHRYFLIHYLTPAIDRVSEIRYWGKALHEATITVLALQRWRLEKNGYPVDLDELVMAGYLSELPMDPYSNQPLVYKRTDDDFVLYSVGANFEDDGGTIVRRDDGRIDRWADEGDEVFWPVSSSEVRKEK
jgi:hypothetical protein